jgi:hypothetical protein
MTEICKVSVVEHPWLLGLPEFFEHFLGRSFNFGLWFLVFSFVNVVDFFLYHATGKAHEAFERLLLKFDLLLLLSGIACLDCIEASQMSSEVIYLEKVLASAKAL